MHMIIKTSTITANFANCKILTAISTDRRKNNIFFITRFYYKSETGKCYYRLTEVFIITSWSNFSYRV